MSDLFLGFYLGVFAIILLFNLLWYVYNKEKAYLYYFFLHLSIVILALSTSKILNIPVSFFAIMAVYFTFLFTKEFLNLDKYFKNLTRKFLYFGFGFTSLLFILFITGNQDIIKNIPFSFLILAIVLLAFRVYKKGFDLAKYFLLAWGVNYVIILLTDMNRILGIDILNFQYLSQVGNILEAVILSFALFAKTRTLQDEKNEKEKMLIHQSRLASMGEMLANISHQWRQPLNRVASFIMNMQLHIMDNYKEEKYLLAKLEESQGQLEYMSTTIDDFTNFYKKDKEKENFLISQVISNATTIISPTLESNKIDLKITINEDFKLNSYPKELAQVLLNLLQNSKDAIFLNNIENPKIEVIVNEKEIIVKDNANGIQEDILNKIFEPYFTTKEKHKGTGLGLYMSRMILEKNINATITAKNIEKNAVFTIVFK
jgi:signal transduction histidine kinase